MPQRARRMPRKYAERTACEEMPGNEAVPPAVERVLQRRVRIPGHVHRRVCRWLDGERTSFERDRAEGVCQTGCRFWRDEAVFAFGRRVVVRLIKAEVKGWLIVRRHHGGGCPHGVPAEKLLPRIPHFVPLRGRRGRTCTRKHAKCRYTAPGAPGYNLSR